MNENKTDLAAPVYYKERQIVLTPNAQEDGTWVCRYSIIERGESSLKSVKGHVDGTFPSREAAELAAVQQAKSMIDL
ncbi:MAG: hypothetical protein QM706_12180 [Nitrospira sp.]